MTEDRKGSVPARPAESFRVNIWRMDVDHWEGEFRVDGENVAVATGPRWSAVWDALAEAAYDWVPSS